MVLSAHSGTKCRYQFSNCGIKLTNLYSRDGDRYAGKYELNEATGQVHGCPARAPGVTDVLRCIKIRAKSRGASAVRNHADAMTIEEIQKLMQWSTSVCPNEMLTVDPKTITDIKDLKLCLEHGFMRAFMSSAFTLWTRLVGTQLS